MPLIIMTLPQFKVSFVERKAARRSKYIHLYRVSKVKSLMGRKGKLIRNNARRILKIAVNKYGCINTIGETGWREYSRRYNNHENVNVRIS